MSRINIKNQFDRHRIHTAFCSDVKIVREDGLSVEYIKKNDFALSNWYNLCDEVDEVLQEISLAKRKVKRYGLLPIITLIGDLVFVLVYSVVSNSKFLFSVNAASLSAFSIAVIGALSLLLFDYRIRVRCTNAWLEVREICRRYSSNVVQYRLRNEKFNNRVYWSAMKYFILIYLPGDRGFVSDRSDSQDILSNEKGDRGRQMQISPLTEEDSDIIALEADNEFKNMYLNDYFETNPKLRLSHKYDKQGKVVVDNYYNNDEEEGIVQKQEELPSFLASPPISQSKHMITTESERTDNYIEERDAQHVNNNDYTEPKLFSTSVVGKIEKENKLSVSWATIGNENEKQP